MGITTNPDDAGLNEIDPKTKMQKSYLVLSEEERELGFLRPVRTKYLHEVCGVVTQMSQAIAETYARDPKYYGATYCVGCGDHFRVGKAGNFLWDGTDEKVGT